MISLEVLSVLSEKFSVVGDLNVFMINLIIAVILLVVGVFLGKFIKFLGKKIIEKSDLERTTKKSFIELFLTVIKWSIYILFVSLALDQLNVPQLTSWLTSTLVIIPAFVGALVLIVIGFAIAVYLKDLIEDSEFVDKKILSMIFFYFTIFVFMIFAIRTALISQDRSTINIVIIVLTAIMAAAVAYSQIKNK